MAKNASHQWPVTHHGQVTHQWPKRHTMASHEFYGHWSHDLDKALMGHQHDGIPLFLTTKVIEPHIVPGHLVYGLLVP